MAVNKSLGDINNFLKDPWLIIEPGPAGWEAWTLPLCYSESQTPLPSLVP